MTTIEPRFAALLHRGRIGQFVSVGGLGAFLETLVVALLTVSFGVSPLAAKAVGAELSISTMFVVNDRWTFAAEGAVGITAFLSRWVKSHLVRTLGLSVAFGTLYVLTSVVDASLFLAGIDFWPTAANVVGIGVGMSINYVAESVFTWDVVGVFDDE